MQHLWEIVDGGNTSISTTEQGLWNGAKEYFKWSIENPVISEILITVGKDAGKTLYKRTTRMYTLKGLCAYCGITEEWLQDIRKSKKKDSLYYTVLTRIMYIIYDQNITQAAGGIFNPIIVAKVLGMDDDNTEDRGPVTINIVQGLPALSESENEVLAKLELENGVVVKRDI